MAGTAMGMVDPQEQTSDFSGFHWGFEEQFLVTDPETFNTGSFSHYQPPDYAMYNPDFQPTLFGGHGRTLSARSMSSPHVMQRHHGRDPSQKDLVNNACLSQGPSASPETVSQALPKRKLADKLLLRNRKSKPRSQQGNSKSGTEDLKGSTKKASSSTGLPMPPSETMISPDYLYGNQSSNDVGSSSYSLDVDPTSIFNQALLGHDTRIPQPSDPDFGGMRADHQPGTTYYESGTQPTGAYGIDSITMTEALVEPVGASQGKLLTQTPGLTGSRSMPTGFYGAASRQVDPASLQQPMFTNNYLRNTSTQTLASTNSSLGDPSSLNSPPSQHPSLPWLSSEFDTRRASDSSELAHNVEGMHLQGPPGLSLATSLGPSPHSSVISANGIDTPDSSPEQFSGHSFATHGDLASRRKRVRPAALRSDSNRNTSRSDSQNGSPHSRTSSLSLGAPAGPRRIQSGQVLHKDQFRVHKSGSNAAQISPRNLQTHFERNSLPHGGKQSASNSANGSPTTPHHLSSKPSASAASANRSPAEYQHEFHVRSASTSHGASGRLQMRHANASVPNLHSSSPAPQVPFPIQIPGQQGVQLSGTQGPPLSAPPHQTTFFGDSPPNQGPFAPPPTHNQGFPQTGSHELAYGIQQSGPYASQPQYLPPFAPHYTFPEGSNMGGFAPTGYLPSYPPGALNLPPPPTVELDIKVEVGPQPSLSRPFERCEFQHTFSNKWRQTTDKK